MRILLRTGLCFYINLHTYTSSPLCFWCRCRGEICVDIDNNALDITLDKFFILFYFILFYPFYISAYDLVSAAICLCVSGG